MKTREQIYGKEAADILRNITTYHCIRHDQFLRMYPGKEEKISNLLSFLVRQGRIHTDKEHRLYYDGAEMEADDEMLAAIWVLTDFIERVYYHSSVDFPAKLVFIADGELYEVVYVRIGNEALVEHALSRQPSDADKRIVIVEDSSQIAGIHIPGAVVFCTVDMAGGDIQYFRQE